MILSVMIFGIFGSDRNAKWISEISAGVYNLTRISGIAPNIEMDSCINQQLKVINAFVLTSCSLAKTVGDTLKCFRQKTLKS